MKSVVLVSAFLLPVISLAHDPSPLLADDGRDLSFLLNRYDGPTPILQRTVKGIVPRTLQVEEVPVRRALNGLVERQSCVPGYFPCLGSLQCCPVATICGPGSCCPIGSLPCIASCKISRSFAFLVLTHRLFFRLPRFLWGLLPRPYMLPSWSGGHVLSTNGLPNF